ncbi:MAG TPA: beta-propeller fold lactonase family protein, partial [Opitutaceae bacterium]
MRPTPMAFMVCTALVLASAAQAASSWVYFGTPAKDAARGIYVAKLDEGTGVLSAATRAADKPDSEFMAFAPDGKHLYALAEVPMAGSGPADAIETYATDTATGALTPVGEQVAGGTGDCHLSVDPSGRCVLTANYNHAYVEVFPILPDGTVGARTCKVPFSGSGPNRSRQESAHAHSINV